MHASHTVDYGVVLSGEVDLELDDGVVKRLKAGDCFVQNGTLHAWAESGRRRMRHGRPRRRSQSSSIGRPRDRRPGGDRHRRALAEIKHAGDRRRAKMPASGICTRTSYVYVCPSWKLRT